MQSTGILFTFILLLFSGCSPFGNSSFIESIGKDITDIFDGTTTPVKSSPQGGQTISNINGYRMNVGLSHISSKTNQTCNVQGYCMDVGLTR